MPSDHWTFFGRILPEKVPISWGTPISGMATINDEYSFTCWYTIALHLGQLVIDAKFEGNDLDIFTMRNFAQKEAEHLSALVGYKFGGMFDVEILSAARKNTSDWIVFGNEIGCLVNARPDRYSPFEGEFLKAVMEDHHACRVLTDFQRSMREDTGFHCYRAVETMMQSVVFNSACKEPEAWKRMRKDLQIKRESIDRIKEFADPIRHGKPKAMSDAQRTEIFEITDKIIFRFLTYVASARIPLNETQFPVI